MDARVLVVEDDEAMRSLVLEDLAERGMVVRGCANLHDALSAMAADIYDVVVSDLNMPGGTGLELCQRVRERDPQLPVILFTAFGSLDAAIGAIRNGAYDFLTKPVELDQLALAVERAASLRALRSEVATLRAAVRQGRRGSRIEGTSAPMLRLRETITQLAGTQATVLVHGESGTGKELVARELHELGPRAAGPFVAENIAAIPPQLLESALFGHVKGAFTGASAKRDGLLLRAHGGTLLLDEVGELPLELQPKLLRVLEERRVRPVGSDQEVAFDVRLIAATHRDLAAAVDAGTFRRDLYYRLAVLELEVPPLRERGRDVLLLAQTFIDQFAKESGRPIRGLHPEAAARLLAWGWPGNVRELRNVIEHAVLVCRGTEVAPADLPDRLRALPAAPPPLRSADAEPELLPLDVIEKRHILGVLRALGGNKAQAARVLGVGRKTLYRKLELWGELAPGEAE
ncbi:MAG: sigma-54-dependent Fis family transcriptional regulator [Deltaproteobacteria bacterium]|jgi:two-component system response regulator AtoC|nr:sigma-54-dependent Fis family transcriptional regulator [Deltaproteobacteria bacterium]